MGIAESFQTQPSSHQIRLPRDSEYNAILTLFGINTVAPTKHLTAVNICVKSHIRLGKTLKGHTILAVGQG